MALLKIEPHRRGWFFGESLAMVLGKKNKVVPRLERVTLAKWLREDGRDAIVAASKHFVHVKGGVVVEGNGRIPMRGLVTEVILL